MLRTGLLFMTWLWVTQSIAGAQSLKIGMNLGANTIYPISTAAPYDRDANGFVFGPLLELSLPRSFAIEATALRKSFRYQRQETSELFPSPEIVQETTVWDTHVTSWEIPVSVKKYVTLSPNIRAFGSAGISTRHTSGRTDISGIRAIPRPSQPGPPGPPLSSFPPPPLSVAFSGGQEAARELDRRWSAGVVIAAGAEFAVGNLSIQPAARYARWSNAPFESADGNLRSSQNSLDLVLSASFEVLRLQ